ncbi:hypothetical protein MNBD_GAMMA01-918 [hydrothermal vent metagenome]|uniref:HIT domain-containing protein n=1 Tax=hydrothermal vent metagenome TaxID=652676 RepID=A0A3B0UW66_9ZZZZ
MGIDYDKNNIFAKILTGEAPCIKIYENKHSLAFMDIMPQREGHVLVIAKEPAITIYDLSDEASLACMQTLKIIGKALEKAMQVNGTSVFQLNGKIAGQSVPHFHFHIIPGSLLNLTGHAVQMADMDKLQATANRIIAQL